MFVLFDIKTCKWRMIVWTEEAARTLPVTNTRVISRLPNELCEAMVENKLPLARIFEGMNVK